ncbi:threonine/homoserine/homoserine lactone efflux protein [Humitalea rosea]|uniref:Threonine/homoserine/homoserine lactone efflux protein n=1 Tax=Humitalea rosea TaxID=990373 RepID=A0A2W7IK93_9PROT|nr:LysE family translocator [Humitalea rosea]PZW38953.1 threonine/homoserine/homoserine lactone efflux protein [Humitalea rosea]
MRIELWFAFVATASAMLVVPGPTILMVIGQSLAAAPMGGLRRWRQVLPLVAGVAAGDAVAMSVSLAGLGAILATSATAFTIMKVAGAGYLVWLGLRQWRAPVGTMAVPPLPPAHAARQAFVVTALNPKGIAFFVAFVPLFIDPAAAYVPQAIALIVTFVTLGAMNAAAYALLAGRLSGAVRQPHVRRACNRVGGGALIAAGLATAALQRG